MGNFESSMSNIMDHDSESADDDYFSNVYDDTYESHEDYFVNFLLQRLINRYRHCGSTIIIMFSIQTFGTCVLITNLLDFRSELTSFDNPRRMRVPTVKVKPNLENLKVSAFAELIIGSKDILFFFFFVFCCCRKMRSTAASNTVQDMDPIRQAR